MITPKEFHSQALGFIESNLSIIPLAVIFTVFIAISFHFFMRPDSRHRRYVRKSMSVINAVNSIESPPKKITYLRKINPYVFEELILSCLDSQGHKIFRNTKYSGDGGIDGVVIIESCKYLIQAKRYNGYVSKRDIENFGILCRTNKCKGLFVHTGRTGKEVLRRCRTSNIDIVSGSRLLNLISGSFSPAL